jgi:hypothetical protein
MTRSLSRWLLAGLVTIVSLGCEPRPVVVDPDDGDTTVIEDDADVEVVPDTTTTQPGTGVDVQVGGDEGVDVNVNPPSTQNPSGSSTDSTPTTNTRSQ